MGHYSDAYEREDDELAKKSAERRAKLLNQIRVERETLGIDEILVRIIEGRYDKP